MSDTRDYIITTDSTADLSDEMIKELELFIHPLYYIMDGEVYGGGNEIPAHEFYERMRNGSTPTTNASNPDFIANAFEDQVSRGLDILHLSFSSGLSCSYSNAATTAEEIMEKHPGSKIVVIDTLCASMGQGLIVYYAAQLKKQGKSIDEVADWVRENIQHICHQFTVESLVYLHRGGRVSKTVMILGTLVNVKPVLHVDEEGHLTPMCNVRGRKKSLMTLVDLMEEQIGSYRDKNEAVMISHGDSLEDAQFVGKLVKERFGIEKIFYNCISPTIGSHSGPGTIALFHLGEHR